jgi:hypothetical protein
MYGILNIQSFKYGECEKLNVAGIYENGNHPQKWFNKWYD